MTLHSCADADIAGELFVTAHETACTAFEIAQSSFADAGTLDPADQAAAATLTVRVLSELKPSPARGIHTFGKWQLLLPSSLHP